MQEDQLISINVWLAGRSYRIRIGAEEEEAVRKAVRVADDKIREMRHNYAGRDDQDFIAMTLLMYAADSATQSFNNPLLRGELQSMIDRIDNYLQSE